MRILRVILGDDDDYAIVEILRPIFQASARRMPNCSMASGCVVGSSRTATCARPLRSIAASPHFKPAALRGVERAGEVRDARTQRRQRHRLGRPAGERQEQAEHGQQRRPGQFHGTTWRAGAAAGAELAPHRDFRGSPGAARRLGPVREPERPLVRRT